jgi:hypothetical protein
LTRETVSSAPLAASGGRRSDVQQRDNLCGPFQAARVLAELGVREWDGDPLDQDLLAVRAGTLLPDLDRAQCVPAGASNLLGYRFDLPVVEANRAGTSAEDLAGVLEAASGGALRAVPLRGPAWDADAVVRLVDFALERGARLIANVRTGPLWGTRPPLESLLSELEGHEAPGPPPEWDVGHFLEPSALVRGRGGSLVVVRDSYPSLGWDGVHLQPPRALAAALRRGDGREGGVLCVLAAGRAGEVEALGLDVGFWDNGTRR